MWKKPSIIFIFLFSIIVIGLKVNIPHTNFISYDNFGYYMHLPAKYIYNDIELETNWHKTINEKYNNTPTYFQTATTDNGKTLMRFYKGMSYLWTPAFLTAHWYAQSTDYPADGFSMPYARALIIFGALFSILGLFIARKILLHYFNEKITALTLLVVYGGTMIFFFITLGNDAPHAYLFTLFASLIWFTIKWHETPKYKYAIMLGVTMGFIVSIRMMEMIVAIIPVLWGVYSRDSLKQKINLVKENYLQVAVAVIIAICFLIPQFYYYFKITGSIFVNIYNDPGNSFNFTHPRFAHVLIGFRKGWFIYSPLSMLGIIGLIMCYRKYKFYFWPVVIYLSILVYIIASFNSLTSYGFRAFAQSTALLFIPIALVVQYLTHKKWVLQGVAGIIIVFFIALNVQNSYKLKMGVIDGSRMTREYYFATFGKMSATEEDRKLLLVKRSDTPVDIIPDDVKFYNHQLVLHTFDDLVIDNEMAPTPYQGTGMYEMGLGNEFSPGLKIPYKMVTKEYYCYLRGHVYVYSHEPITNLWLVLTTVNKKGQHVKYKAITFDTENPFIPGEWNKLTIDYQTHEYYNVGETFVSYVWYTGKQQVWIDKFEVIAFTLDDIYNKNNV